MIESGSHTPGVDPAAFRLPSVSGYRYELPAPDLAAFVDDYHVFDSTPRNDEHRRQWMLPSAPAMRFILAPAPMALVDGGGKPDPLPRAALYGITTRAAEMLTGDGGVTVGVTLTPIGFARLFDSDASALRDRATPLADHLDPSAVGDLTARLHDHDRGRAVKRILDTALRALLGSPHPQEAEVAAIAALLAQRGLSNLGCESRAAGIPGHRLQRLSRRHFGYPPKLLLRRARFLRSLIRIKLAGPPFDFTLIDPAYHDQPHFIRDAHRFLGMTPLQFLRQDTPYLDSVLRARMIVRSAARAARSPGER